MNLQDYRLNAYSAGASQNKKLVHKPVFENVNSAIDRIEKQNKENAERQNIEQAKIAAKTGTWFEKKKSATSDDVKDAAKNLTSGGLVKIPASSTEKDNIYRRVAKFLVIVGIDEAAKILPHLTEEQTEKIIPEIASIQKITPEESASILEEFESLVEKAREEGGLETARNILTKAYGSEKAEDMLKKSVKYPDGKPFDYLSDANAERIKVLIDGESDAVKSLVLSQIEPKKAAKVINLMDVDDKKKIVLRLAKMKPVAPEVLAEIDKSLHEKLLTQNTENSQNMDGRGVLAQILKRMNPSAENSIINTLSEQDPELGEDLRKRLFTEEDVIGSDDRFIQNYLHDMEDRDIAILIYGKNDAFREKILSNVSKNRRRVVLDEESMIHHLTKSDSEKITSSFYSVLRRAWENGDLRVLGRDEGEVYV
ncbi:MULTISPECIES: flagellar motor switch protein FliG [unclassified Treponema]|uniref:flagellar motor switch protein FliG n=1 Tax=unclassified Treponema TaxID=2638727 RepID=UPI000E9F928A|nr:MULTISPECIES: flagellar motor switch protein FliG [unclassified Treponema]HBP09412.1 flagellar motor switch protein FliG [Treponema sp.]